MSGGNHSERYIPTDVLHRPSNTCHIDNDIRFCSVPSGSCLRSSFKRTGKTTKDQKDAAETEIAAIQKQISNLGKKGRIDKEKLEELEAKLKQLRKQDERFERKLSRIGKAPQLLTVKGGVLPPASWLLGALILSAGAWYLSTIENIILLIPVLIWILSLSAIGYSILRIYRSLRVIESVAITSEEAALKRTIDAFKIAQKEVEEAKKPKLELEFEDAQPPFHVEAESEMIIKFAVGLSRGDVARNVVVAFLAPQGFEFPDSVARLPSRYKKYASYVSTRIALEDITKPLQKTKRVKLKAPPQPEHYTAIYRLVCEGFDCGYQEFKIVVEEPDIPF